MNGPVVVFALSWRGDGVSIAPLDDGVFEVAYDPAWTAEADAWAAACWLLGESADLPERGAA